MVCVIVWPLKDFLFVLFFAFLIGGIVEDKDLHLKISKSLVSFQDFFQNFKMCQIPSTNVQLDWNDNNMAHLLSWFHSIFQVSKNVLSCQKKSERCKKKFKIEIKNVSKTFGELVKNMPILKKNLTQHMWVCHRDCRFLNFDDPRILWSFYIQVHSPLQIFSLLQINAL